MKNQLILSGILIISFCSTVATQLQCDLPLVTGRCRASFPRWGSKDGKCVTFTYGGCEANTNNFITKSDCERACPPTTTKEPVEICQLPLATGLCKGIFPRWGSKDGKCVEFTYGGCGGNDNNFQNKHDCEATCSQPGDYCKLPLVKGPCSARLTRWGSSNGSCVEFVYGGCSGNSNSFWSREECERACPPNSTRPPVAVALREPVDICQLPLVTGMCLAYFPSWGSQAGECVSFIYGGCSGNENRFSTKAECEKACPPLPNFAYLSPVYTCQLTLVTGQCVGYFSSWGSKDGICVETKAECERACPSMSASVTSTPVDTCQQPLVTGQCRGYFPSWGSRNGVCVEFIYGGCEGNDNRFESREECERACPSNSTTPPIAVALRERVDICQLPLVTGMCLAYFPSWGSQAGKCVSFIYGGCSGNENRFSVAAKFVPRLLNDDQKQRRIDICSKLKTAVLHDPDFLKTVITTDESWVYGYDPETKMQSSQWKSPESPRPKKARMSRSAIRTLLVVFFDIAGIVHKEFLPPGTNVNQYVYRDILRRLNESIRRKRPTLAKPGGWRLHQDNAPAHTSLTVNEFCAKHSISIVPHPPYSSDLAPCDFWLFPKLKFSLKSERFEDIKSIKRNTTLELRALKKADFCHCFEQWQRRWTKCIDSQGMTKAECEKACPPREITTAQVPVDICQLPLVAGSCRANLRSWGNRGGACVEFVYGGCEGNENRFQSREECERACPPNSTTPPIAVALRERVDICQLPLVTGMCLAYFPSWGSQAGECVSFIYGGCTFGDESLKKHKSINSTNGLEKEQKRLKTINAVELQHHEGMSLLLTL
ncbi:papilin-like [Watersipora subatra]|uniref:papilin-like n=1 Tax=Watersipora subatra TaxID=2589382 RepID=UPI00355C1155